VIRSIRVGADKVKEDNAEKIHLEFDDIAFKPSECVEEFAPRILCLANQLRSLRDDLPDKKVVKKMLQSILEDLEQVAISMETLLDVGKMSIKVAANHLQAVDSCQSRKQLLAGKEVARQFLLIEEQWKARSKAAAGEKSGGSSGSGDGAGAAVAGAVE
jgi:hypothetical protein